MSQAPMNIVIVSRRALIRDLVSRYCDEQGYSVRGSFDFLSDIPEVPEFLTVLLHVSGGETLGNIEIDAFRARHPRSHVIVLCSKLMHDNVATELTSKVEALIVDDSSLRALTGVLTLVQEGFRLTPPLGQTPAPELGESRSVPVGPLDFSVQPPVQAASQPGAAFRQPDPASTLDPEDLDDDPSTSQPVLAKLSTRERAVIRKLREGASNKDIAKDLHIGESTVKVHLRSCYRKIGVRNRTQAAMWVAKNIPS